MFELLLSISPVVIVMVGIVLLNQRSDRVAIVSMIYTGLVAYFYFSKGTDVILADAKGGLIGTLQICSIIFGAFCLLNVVRFSGAMDRINITISDFSNDKRVLVILIAFCFGAFIEGAAGAGTPAAIAAPFLVALGFDPMVAVVASLLSNGLPASFGGAGVTTIMGSAAINDIVPLMEASKMTGRFHMIGGLITPMLLIYLLYGKKALQSKGIKGYLLSVGAAYGATYFVVSNFIGPELNSMSVGLVSLLVGVLYVKFVGVETPPEFAKELSEEELAHRKDLKYSIGRAISPYAILMISLPIIRFNVPWAILTKFGYATYVGTVIFVVSMIGSFILAAVGNIPKVIKTSFISVVPPFIAMFGLTVVANFMKSTGMMSIIAKSMSVMGSLYPIAAVYIGTLGAFMTGTALGSNIMFSGLHMEAAQLIGLPPSVVYAANSAGASLGNQICPNNVIAVNTTVGILGREGEVIKACLKGWGILSVLYSILAVLYANVLFPL